MQITRLRRLLLFALAAGTLFWSAPLPAKGTGTQVVFRSGTTIDAPGNYLLLNDISTGGPSPAITITSGGVTLDLNGHQITGPGGNRETGIMIDGASGVKVFNGYVAYLGFAVVVNNSSNVVLRDLHIRGQGVAITAPPPEVGIMILQSKNVCVEKNVIYNVGLGVFVRGGQSWGNRIEGNTITANTNGIFGLCYNPAPDDPEGPRGDLIQNNLITGFNVGIQVVPTAVYNVFRDNVIAFITTAMELGNSTNQDIDNVGVQLPSGN